MKYKSLFDSTYTVHSMGQIFSSKQFSREWKALWNYTVSKKVNDVSNRSNSNEQHIVHHRL